MIAATPNSNSNTTSDSENSNSLPNNSQTTPKFADLLAQSNSVTTPSAAMPTQQSINQTPQSQQQTQLSQPGATNGSGNGDSTKPKRKLNLKMVVGVMVLFLILLGSGVGFYLTQYTQQDIRQQASVRCDNLPQSDCNGGCEWIENTRIEYSWTETTYDGPTCSGNGNPTQKSGSSAPTAGCKAGVDGAAGKSISNIQQNTVVIGASCQPTDDGGGDDGGGGVKPIIVTLTTEGEPTPGLNPVNVIFTLL